MGRPGSSGPRVGAPVRLLLISTERIGPRMAAGGARYFELARALRPLCDVACLAPVGSERLEGLDQLTTYDPRSAAAMAETIDGADVVFGPPLMPSLAAAIRRARRPWVVDLINPEPFEGLEYHRMRGFWQRQVLAMLRIDRVTYALRRGDVFTCASERQRDMWLGMLAASRRLDPAGYDSDPQLRELIEVIPTGIDESAPAAPSTPVLRGTVLPTDARIVLWNGGVWDWFDPRTAIEAARLLHARDERWRLFFMSTGRPSVRAAMSTAALVTGAGGEAVRFNSEWVPYDERAGYLLEADVCVSTHRPTIEARFAYRNRLLDCVWAGLPVVCTEGDSIADLVASQGWGRVVPPEDPRSVANALEEVVEAGRDSFAKAMSQYREHHTWADAAAKLHAVAVLALGRPARRRSVDLAAALARIRHGAASALRPPG